MNVVVRAVAAAAVGFASCATVPSVADRRFAAGDYQGAAAAYEEALRTDRRAHLDAGLCLRLGIAYAVPGTAAHDPSRAAAVLRDVATRFPKSAEGAQAALLAPQLDYEARLSADLAVATTRVGALEAEIARVREDYRGLGAEAKTTAEQLARALAQLAEKDVQLRRVRDELERLKSIDLRRSP